MFVVDIRDSKVYAYNLATGDYDPDKDITLASDNSAGTGIWGDDSTIWVANAANVNRDSDFAKIFAYRRADNPDTPSNEYGSRDPDKDFNALHAAGNRLLRGICSDGTTMWVVNAGHGTSPRVFAYNMSDKSRRNSLEVQKIIPVARGAWCEIGNSDRGTLWVVDRLTGKLHRYGITVEPPLQSALAQAELPETAPGMVGGLTHEVDATGITLSWQRPEEDGGGAPVFYRVERSTDGSNYEELETGTLETSWRDAAPPAEGGVFYRVTAYNAVGEGPWSGVALILVDEPDEAGPPDPGPLAGFSLVAGGTGVELLELAEGVQVVTGDYSASSFAIRANLAAGETVGSVRFQLVRDGVNVTANGSKTESYAPYSLYGDGGENSLTGAPLPEGSYLLTATAHSEKDAGGEHLGRLEVSFTVVETAPTPADTPAQQQQEPAPVQNSSATGAPAIDGNARVGETLTADVSGIADADELTNATFTYQWLRGDTDIPGATGETYTLVAEDQGQTIKVRVSFTDDRGHQESRTSDATGAVEAKPNNPATGAPTIDGTAQVGETLTADTSGIADADELTNAVFAYQWLRGDADIPGATGDTYTLVEADAGQTIKVRVSFTDDAGHAEARTSAPTAAVDAKPNSPATGRPAIDGEAQVGETLTADASGIADVDRLTNAVFAYQWLRGDAAIAGATGETYTLVAADEGRTIKVRVSFTDDAGHQESRTSAATGAVAAMPVPGRPQDLAGEASAPGIALTWEAPEGSVVAHYVVYRGILQNGSMNGRPVTEHATVEATGAAMEYTDAAVEAGEEYRYRVAAVNSAGEGRKSGWVNVRAGS